MSQIPHADPGRICPFHKQDMAEVCHTCPLWTYVRGFNPNTGIEVDRWDCSLSLMPMMMIEVAQQARQGAAATESFRNEMVALAGVRREQQMRVIHAGNDRRS